MPVSFCGSTEIAYVCLSFAFPSICIPQLCELTKSDLPWVQLTQEESFGFMPRLSIFYERWCPESGRGKQHQSERQRHTDTIPYYTQRWTEKHCVPEAETETQRALYPVALVPLSKGAQQYQTGSVPSLLSSRPNGPLCSVKETVQPHCPLPFMGHFGRGSRD